MTLFTFVFMILWTVLVFGSIAWYAFLLFYVGAKGGREIRQMTKRLSERGRPDGGGSPSEPLV